MLKQTETEFKNSHRRKILFSLGIGIIVVLAGGIWMWRFWSAPKLPANENPLALQYLDAPFVETVETKQPVALPSAWDIAVPFTSQAPFANWDLPYQEACEEATALMAHYYWQGKTFTPQIADQEIRALVAFQNQRYGFYKDTTLAETKRFMEDYWGYHRLEIYEAKDQTATLQKIKATLAQNIPVIVPAAGRLLNNPNFTAPGPLYHYLIIRGYTTDNKIITNDPGTRKGERYIYTWNVLYNAIHDWNDGAVTSGARVILLANK